MELCFEAPVWRSLVMKEPAASGRREPLAPPLRATELSSRTATVAALFVREALSVESRVAALLKYMANNVALDIAFAFIAGSRAEHLSMSVAPVARSRAESSALTHPARAALRGSRAGLLAFLKANKYFPNDEVRCAASGWRRDCSELDPSSRARSSWHGCSTCSAAAREATPCSAPVRPGRGAQRRGSTLASRLAPSRAPDFLQAVLRAGARATGSAGSGAAQPGGAPFSDAFAAEPVITHVISQVRDALRQRPPPPLELERRAQLLLLDVRLEPYRAAVLEAPDFNLRALFRHIAAPGSEIVSVPDVKARAVAATPRRHRRLLTLSTETGSQHFLETTQCSAAVSDDIVRGLMCRFVAGSVGAGDADLVHPSRSQVLPPRSSLPARSGVQRTRSVRETMVAAPHRFAYLAPPPTRSAR